MIAFTHQKTGKTYDSILNDVVNVMFRARSLMLKEHRAFASDKIIETYDETAKIINNTWDRILTPEIVSLRHARELQEEAAKSILPLRASEVTKKDEFGESVALEGSYAVVGAPGADVRGENSGAAFIFRRDGGKWTGIATLFAFDGESHDSFGSAVAIRGPYVVVGAYREDEMGEDAGAAYVFKRHSDSLWIPQTKLVPKDPVRMGYFGRSLSMDGDAVLVGAYGTDEQGGNPGHAYVFERKGEDWLETGRLSPKDETQVSFGKSVGLRGKHAIVGANLDDDLGENAGAVYLFGNTGKAWRQLEKITAFDGGEYDYFGSSVAMSERHFIVGSPTSLANESISGSAYIFEQTKKGWINRVKLTVGDSAEDSRFGNTVDVNDDYAAVGAYWDDDNGNFSGSVYLFKRQGRRWMGLAKVTTPDGKKRDFFGKSLDLDGKRVIAGAPGNDKRGIDTGSAYIIE